MHIQYKITFLILGLTNVKLWQIVSQKTLILFHFSTYHIKGRKQFMDTGAWDTQNCTEYSI